MNRLIARLLPVILALFLAPSAFAEISPYALLQQVGGQLFQQISSLTPAQRQQAKVMQDIVAKQLMPYVDHRFAAYKIMGKYVKSASKEQRNAFVDAMYGYLVATYANALSQYNNQQVHYEPAHDVAGKRIVTVRTEIVAADAPTINIDFKLRQNSKTGEWKAFDMVVEGISLLSSKQAEIASQIRQLGLEGTIAKLQQKGQQV